MARHVKITEPGFKAGIGFMLAIAVLVAIARVAIRTKLNRKVYLDDGLYFFAVVTLVAGTIMTYIDIPYIYLQQNVQSGAQQPPADLIQQLIHSVKIQDAAVVLLSSTIFAVKLSFMAFFRSLIRRLRKLEIWWWCVLVIVVPSSVMLVISNFITCGYFDERILVKCVSAGALKRQNNTLKAVTILDIFSDVFSRSASFQVADLLLTTLPVITIPVALLWRVRLDVRRKMALGTTLCLGIFTIVTAIVRLGGGNSAGGQIDSSWVIFWLQIEAAVAVMVVSITTFRALFIAERLQKQESPRYTGKVKLKYWSGTKDSDEAKEHGNHPGTPIRNATAGEQSSAQPTSSEEEQTTRDDGQGVHQSQSHSRAPSEAHSNTQILSSHEMV
ncbi:MAG: hypothetical protein Q9207_008335 [Kuettlingeria erythrocarpa]